MSSILSRFSFESAKWNSGVSLALITVWVAVLACIFSSILAQPFDRRQRVFWMAIVVLLPGIGVLAYLPFAFRKEQLPPIFHGMSKHRKQQRKHPPADSDA